MMVEAFQDFSAFPNIGNFTIISQRPLMKMISERVTPAKYCLYLKHLKKCSTTEKYTLFLHVFKKLLFCNTFAHIAYLMATLGLGGP